MNQAYANSEQNAGANWPGDASAKSSLFVRLINRPEPSNSSHFLGKPMAGFEQQMAEFAIQQQEEINRLLEAYVFDDPNGVRSFLKNHRSVAEILLEAVPHLKQCFGGDPTLRLQVLSNEGYQGTIYGVVSWKQDLSSARSALQRFDDSWWINSSRRASGRIVFDYQLV